jgi:hypothetical protein
LRDIFQYTVNLAYSKWEWFYVPLIMRIINFKFKSYVGFTDPSLQFSLPIFIVRYLRSKLRHHPKFWFKTELHFFISLEILFYLTYYETYYNQTFKTKVYSFAHFHLLYFLFEAIFYAIVQRATFSKMRSLSFKAYINTAFSYNFLVIDMTREDITVSPRITKHSKIWVGDEPDKWYWNPISTIEKVLLKEDYDKLVLKWHIKLPNAHK